MQALIRSDEVVARVIAGETLIIPVRANVADLGSIYRFNETGTLIWSLLESPRTVAELSAAVAQKYEIESAVAERDVKEFLSELQSVGLVEVPAIAVAGD